MAAGDRRHAGEGGRDAGAFEAVWSWRTDVCRNWGGRRCPAYGDRMVTHAMAGYTQPQPARVQSARVLGVDPGLTRCGLGVVDGVPGRPPKLVAVGVVRTGADEDIAARLLAIETEIERWLDDHK